MTHEEQRIKEELTHLMNQLNSCVLGAAKHNIEVCIDCHDISTMADKIRVSQYSIRMRKEL